MNGEVEFKSSTARDGFFFLPNAVTLPEFLHGIFGLLREALEGTDAWAAFEPVLQEIVNVLANKMFRDRIIALLMLRAEKHERQRLHSFEGHRFDWRWETLEVLLDQLCEMWPHIATPFRLQGTLTGWGP